MATTSVIPEILKRGQGTWRTPATYARGSRSRHRYYWSQVDSASTLNISTLFIVLPTIVGRSYLDFFHALVDALANTHLSCCCGRYYRRGALFKLLQIIRPGLHHFRAFLQIFSMVVDAANFSALYVGQLSFDRISAKTHLVQEGRRRSPKAMC